MTTELNKYQKLSELEHIIARPGIYIGSVSNTVQNSWVVNKDKMQDVEVAYNPGILKLFDEILSNSVDEHLRSGKVKTIWVETSPMTGYITIKDDGGIPVIRHPEYNTYIPEMIFGELRTGSNFDDDERITAGTNGLGSKLTSVFSVEFKVDTCDGKNRFVQVFRNNLSEKGKAVIQPNTDAGTTITFLPDYKRFDCSLDEGNLKKIERRVYDVAGCNPSIKVYYNGKHIKIAKVADYGAMFSDEFVFDTPTNDFTVGVSPSVGDGFQQVSFVNGIDTFNGGTHVAYVCDQITQKIRDYINKKHKVDVKPNTIKQQMFLFIRCTINAPSFTSQTKENMSSEVRNFGTSWTPSDKFIKKLIESSVVQKVLDWVEGEKRREELAQMRKLNNQTQNTNFLKRIVKFDDATSKDRSECTIYFTEGDCIKDDTMITVMRCSKLINLKISEIEMGDFVLTHNNRYKSVVNKTYSTKKSLTFKLSDTEDFVCSEDHMMFVYDKIHESLLFLKAKDIDKTRHTLIKNRLNRMAMLIKISSVEFNPHFDSGVHYHYKLYVNCEVISTTSDHTFLVLDSTCMEYKLKAAKLLTTDDYIVMS